MMIDELEEQEVDNEIYWRAVEEAAEAEREREEAGETGPPYHYWWTPY